MTWYRWFHTHLEAWLQDDTIIDEMIIGREIVFDLFDVECKQADETIVFTRRKE